MEAGRLSLPNPLAGYVVLLAGEFDDKGAHTSRLAISWPLVSVLVGHRVFRRSHQATVTCMDARLE